MQPEAGAFSENETKDVLTALYQDGHVDLVLADRIAVLMASASLRSASLRETAPAEKGFSLGQEWVSKIANVEEDKP